MAGICGKSGPPGNQNAFRHGLAAVHNRRADGELTERKRDIRAEYKVPQDFFGTASTPLVEGRLLIVNAGAPGGPCVVALEKATGKEVWRAGKEWGPSYASPVPAVVHGQRRVFVFAGGESDPPTGGLMCIDRRVAR